MIQKDALQLIATLGRDAAGIEVVGVPDLEKVLVRNGDVMETHDLPPERRRIEVHGFDDLVSLVKKLGTNAEVYHEGAESPAEMEPGTVYDGGAIRVLLDSAVRRDVAELRLRPSDLFMQIIALTKAGTLDLVRAILMLRFQLPLDGIRGAGGLISKLRTVDFKSSETASVDVRHGRESMGVALEREVTQAADIPDEIEVSVPLYSNDERIRKLSTVTIKLGIFLDVEKRGVQIKPLADEIDSASADVQGALGKLLRDELPGVPVFHGCPTPNGFLNPRAMAAPVRGAAGDGGGRGSC